MIARLLLAAVLCAATWHAAVGQVQGSDASARGIEQFRGGDYAGALQSFLEAQRGGVDTPGLRYNLAVTYYRLGRHADAEREFSLLARDPDWAPLAHYNLGLTAQRMGRETQAREYFERARRGAEDPRLRALAAEALERLGPPPASTSVFLSGAAGYDSNPTLLPDAATAELRDDGDAFFELLSAASHRVSGTAARAVYMHGGLYARRHDDLDPFDQAALRVGVSRDRAEAAWQRGIGVYVDHVEASSGRLQQAAILDAYAWRRLDGERDLRARYQFAAIDAGAGFGYLEGWQQRFSMGIGLPLARARVRLGYELELNDRDDFHEDGVFFSYSPTRHWLWASMAVPAGAGWRLELRGELSASRYNDPHRLSEGAAALTREDGRWGAGLRASRPLSDGLRLFLDYGYYRNDSNISIYHYDRHQALVGVEPGF